ncbi:MAG: adenylate/guanylate cyclase domain-containing protein [Bacteroidota bacterium]|nr:adenylate/guanylate cyclase domain-containing protein [Bacteroidota bacterium]
MAAAFKIFRITKVNRMRIKTVIFIAGFWTAIDFVIAQMREETQVHTNSIWFREALMFSVSVIMGYLFVYRLKKMLRRYPLWASFLLKSAILLGSAFLLTFIIQFFNSVVISGDTPAKAYHSIQDYALHRNWLFQKIIYWLTIFFVTQLILIINEKYSPGVFLDILSGKYVEPKVENRIVMFIDLKDSTPMAEKLGHRLYFEFIREFIYRVSLAIIEFEGTIYQYVGDEIVCSWKNSEKNSRKCLDAVLQSRKNIQKKSTHFRRKYGAVPEFRVGINVGEVTVGEIGVIKKDIAMSGDTMNTTARIRSACNELNHHFIVSKGFVEAVALKGWQTESLGIVDLKGKEHGIELFSLKI